MFRYLHLVELIQSALSRDEHEIVKCLLEKTGAGGCLWYCSGDILISSFIKVPVSRIFLNEEVYTLLDALQFKYKLKDVPEFPEVDFDETTVFENKEMNIAFKKVFPAFIEDECIGGLLIFSSDSLEEREQLIKDAVNLLGISFLFRKLEREVDTASDRFLQLAELGGIFTTVGEPLQTISKILEHSLQISEAETGAIIRIGGNSEYEVIGMRQDMLKEVRFKNDVSLLDMIMKPSENKPVVIRKSELNASLKLSSTVFNLENLISYPIIFETRHYGALLLINLKERWLSEPSFIAMMNTVARLAAAALTMEERQKERLEQELLQKELSAARTIQSSLLPHKFPKLSGLSISGLWKPSRSVSGDYYDVIELGRNMLGVIIADVSGKGIPASLLMALSRSYLKVIAPSYPNSPGLTINKLNECLCSEMASNKFITAMYMIIDMEKQKALFANAGHIDPMIINKFGDVKILTAAQTSGGLPLGIRSGEKYEDMELDLEKGMTILLYTDGIIEARDEKKNLLGINGLKKFAEELHSLPSELLLRRLWEKTLEYAGEPEDDWTCIGIKIE